MPYACLQVDWPGWLLEFRGGLFIAWPEEQFLLDFSGLLRPGSCKDQLSPLGPSDELGDSVEVFSGVKKTSAFPPSVSERRLRLAAAGQAAPAALGCGLGVRVPETALLGSAGWEVKTEAGST